MDIPSLRADAVPLMNIVIDGNAISFTAAAPGMPTFSGRFLKEGTAITGTLEQDSLTLPFRLARNLADLEPASDAVEPSVTLEDVSGSLDGRPFFASSRHSAIRYSTLAATDRVAELSRLVEEGKVQLKFDERSGYLQSVLDALRLPIESQSVVFSKTSAQAHFIGPANPRALYFSDDVAVGFVRYSPLLELAAQDPQQGVVFYTLDQRNADRPRIVRNDSCLSCHQSRNSLDVPGMLLRSVGVDGQGLMLPQLANYVSDHRSPFDERWSGWYVTGKTDALHHLGVSADLLTDKFDVQGYPSPYSDVAALMVLDHQGRMTNLLTRVGWEARIALNQEKATGQGKNVTQQVLRSDSRELVDYLFFLDEPRIPGRIQSTGEFAKVFTALGPRDHRDRSLRELNLDRRLMRYPCSYMIYSAAFDALPLPVKDEIYKRMWEILSGTEKDPKYSSLAPADREAIVQILRDTKKDLPGYFR